MPTEQKSPTTTTVVVAGWNNPANAYSSDDQRASSSQDGAIQEYNGYGFSVPSDQIINQVIVKVEGYLGANRDNVYVSIYDGASWYERLAPLTYTEQIVNVDFTQDTAWNPSKVNAIKTRIRYYYSSGGGGCFPPDAEFIGFDGQNFSLKKACDCKVGDYLLGFDGSEFKPSKITKIYKHVGKWEMIRGYHPIPSSYMKRIAENLQLKSLLNILPIHEEKGIVADFCVTSNHPVFTRNKGEIPAGQLEVGDLMSELLWEKGRFHVAAVQIEKIDKFECEGEVYDIKSETKWMFSGYLLRHQIKTP